MGKNLVFIDSNAIITNNYSLITPRIVEFVNSGNKIVVSEVTIEEVIKHYNKNQKVQVRKLEEIKRELDRYGVHYSFNKVSETDINERFNEELTRLSVETLSNSRANVDFILSKALNLKKPFKAKNDKESGGVKDALIWNAILSYSKEEHYEYDSIVIVTNDSDFIDLKSKKLEQDLIDDLIDFEIPVEKVSLYINIKELLEELILPETTFVNVDLELYDKFDEQDFNEKIDEIIDHNMDRIKTDLEELLLEFLGEEKEPTIKYIQNLRNVDLNNETLVEQNDTINVYFTEEFEFDCEYFLLKSEYLELGSKNIEIEDSNWNKWVFLVSEKFYTQIGFNVIFKLENEKLVVEETNYYIDNKFVPSKDGSIYDDGNF
ncbi:PIN domain-containing protein [Paenibacillus dendritiformis]|uniref:PIN domain-containing protein n=1 Tax=Paenibacillus dendritiformis TaxID=130049 RepID=UPI00387E0318